MGFAEFADSVKIALLFNDEMDETQRTLRYELSRRATTKLQTTSSFSAKCAIQDGIKPAAFLDA
jgi:hypothetical protein